MKGIVYAGLIILLMAIILPVFAFSNSPPGLQKATCCFVAEENPMIITDQLVNADHLIIKVEQNELKFIVVSDLITKDENQELPNNIYKRSESSITQGDRMFLYRKARDAL
jgi:hypothetical protein